jgi:hypothetical protein
MPPESVRLGFEWQRPWLRGQLLIRAPARYAHHVFAGRFCPLFTWNFNTQQSVRQIDGLCRGTVYQNGVTGSKTCTKKQQLIRTLGQMSTKLIESHDRWLREFQRALRLKKFGTQLRDLLVPLIPPFTSPSCHQDSPINQGRRRMSIPPYLHSLGLGKLPSHLVVELSAVLGFDESITEKCVATSTETTNQENLSRRQERRCMTRAHESHSACRAKGPELRIIEFRGCCASI